MLEEAHIIVHWSLLPAIRNSRLLGGESSTVLFRD